MAITMARGSLFAILLRSPWWYSVLIALLIIFVSLLIVDGKYVVLGVATALPFFGIAGYCIYSELQRPTKKRVTEVALQAKKLSSKDLANKIAANYEAINFDIAAVKGDVADLELERGRHKILLNCKRFKAAKTGIEPLKKMVAHGESVEASGYLYVALGEISENAVDYAKANDIELVRADTLAAFFDGKKQLV